ncbi:MAG TPA: DoxX family protein [Chthoniobacterales bacterium]
MKKDKVIYWIATGIVSAIMLVSAINFGFNPEMKGAFAHLGLPNWFRIELTVAKILGALALLLPWVPRGIKSFAYAGFAITMGSAIIAHTASGDGARSLDPLVFLGILAVSYWYHGKSTVPVARATGRYIAFQS